MKNSINTVPEALLNNKAGGDPIEEDHLHELMRSTVVLSSILILNFDELTKLNYKGTKIKQFLKTTTGLLETYLDNVFDELQDPNDQSQKLYQVMVKVQDLIKEEYKT